MALVDKVDFGGGFVPSALRSSNTSGAPITSATDLDNGEMIPDEYTMTLSAVAGGTATVTVATASPNNPVNGRVVNGVPVDGASSVVNVVPGVGIVFAGGSANGNVGKIFAGIFLGVFDAFGVEAGEPSEGLRHQVLNDGASAVSDAKARLLTQAVAYRKTGQVFNFIKPFAAGATEKTAGGGSSQVIPYALKVVNVAGVGAAKTADLQVDGVTLGAASLLNITTGLEVSGVGVKATPGFPYRVLTGPLTDLEFELSNNCVTNDIENVLVFNSRFIQIAPDVAGAEGAYNVTDVVLTQAGQSAGVIQAAQVAYYWTRVLVPPSGNAESNPHPGLVALEASETASAGWGIKL